MLKHNSSKKKKFIIKSIDNMVIVVQLFIRTCKVWQIFDMGSLFTYLHASSHVTNVQSNMWAHGARLVGEKAKNLHEAIPRSLILNLHVKLYVLDVSKFHSPIRYFITLTHCNLVLYLGPQKLLKIIGPV